MGKIYLTWVPWTSAVPMNRDHVVRSVHVKFEEDILRMNQHAEQRKTCHRYDIPGHAHFLTFSCYHRQPFLSRDRTRRWFIESLCNAKTKHSFDLWGYVIMPEHVHLLIFPREEQYSISQILVDIKRPVAQKALRYVKQNSPNFLEQMKDETSDGKMHYRFWQRGGGYDRNIIKATTVHHTIDYIHANPVRRGLVQSPGDWLWSSAGYYTDKRESVLQPDDESIPPLDNIVR